MLIGEYIGKLEDMKSEPLASFRADGQSSPNSKAGHLCAGTIRRDT